MALSLLRRGSLNCEPGIREIMKKLPALLQEQQYGGDDHHCLDNNRGRSPPNCKVVEATAHVGALLRSICIPSDTQPPMTRTSDSASSQEAQWVVPPAATTPGAPQHVQPQDAAHPCISRHASAADAADSPTQGNPVSLAAGDFESPGRDEAAQSCAAECCKQTSSSLLNTAPPGQRPGRAACQTDDQIALPNPFQNDSRPFVNQ